MKLQINGETKSLQLQQENLSNLINRIGHDPRTVVVELNGSILRSDQWESQGLKEGDVIEIVTIVGGGS
ncbi:sulfur carrier protein ThiS [Prochlorococcus sp. MIT 1341]|uniref:sulfur carrier protein ThiS n=1 Tax=Prochlorococcus sp. MIT 1341 TaxID=3096221 RepID=UPI002A74DD94|nr:sulfur carrier protein ThiS [Prochlorococcus sp. MIT 1341]